MGQIAVLGTGLLGSGFAVRALEMGHQVRVWNRTRSKCAELVSMGASQGDTPADAIRGCERIHLILRADDAVEEVIRAMRPGLAPECWIIDHSTNLPKRVAERTIRLRNEGIQYIHAPVFMGPSHSRTGTGQMLISGPEDIVAALRPALEETTGNLICVGSRWEDAAVRKIIGNGLIIGLSGLAGDLLKAGRAAGFADEQTLNALQAFSPMAARMGQRASQHGQSPKTFELSMARKDIALLLETVPPEVLSVLPGLAAAMDASIDQGQGDANYTAFLQ